MQKKSELSEISYQTEICQDRREARLEIKSGRYDSFFEKILKIYFSSEYNNTNTLKIEKSEIRKNFLEDFEFRKSLIEFGEKKGLGKENPQVRKALKQPMTFEGETIEEIKKGYSGRIKSLFFEKPESETKDKKEDPIFNLLSEEDKPKVRLSKKYGGNIKTFSKLIAILELVDNSEQEDILKYLLDDNFKKELLLEDILAGSKYGNLSVENIFKIIDTVGENSYENVLKIFSEGKSLYDNDIKKKGFLGNIDYSFFTDSIILHTIKKHLGNTISMQGYEFILGNLSYQKINRNKENIDIIKKLIEQFINELKTIDRNTDKSIFNLLIKCFEYIYMIGAININNERINFDIIEDIYNEKYKGISNSYHVLKGIGYCKKSQKF